MSVELIVGTTPTFGIGIGNKLPWKHCPEDMAIFQKVTKGNIVIMGANTWRSLPGPLVGRKCVIITSDPSSCRGYPAGENFITFDYNTMSADDIIKELTEVNRNIIIIGGVSVYNMFFNKIEILHHSRFKKDEKCDTFFDVGLFSRLNPLGIIQETKEYDRFTYIKWIK